MPTFPVVLPAIKVSQPLGEFFVVTLDAATFKASHISRSNSH